MINMSFHCLKILDNFHFHSLNGSLCTTTTTTSTTSVDASDYDDDDVADDDFDGGDGDCGLDDDLL